MNRISISGQKEKSVLVIARKPNECLRINDDIQIKLIKVDGESVSFGITAPKHIPVTSSKR
ncbi:carbon storage regulator [Pseudomonas yamanorum]